jgi:DNA-binding transcriptional ArsR family regulator
MFIVEQQAPTQTDIVNSIGLSSSYVNWHMRRLIDFRLVEEIKEGKYRRYQLRNRKVSSKVHNSTNAKLPSCHMGEVER